MRVYAHVHIHTYVQRAATAGAALCVSGQKPCSGERRSRSEAGNDLETVGGGRLWAFHDLLSFYFPDNKYESIKHRNKDNKEETS